MPFCTACGKKLKTSACSSCDKSHHSLFLQYHYEVPSNNKKKQKQTPKLDQRPTPKNNSPTNKNSPTASTARIFGRLKRSFSTSNVESPKQKQTRPPKVPTKTTQKSPAMFKKSPRRMNKTSSVSGLSSFYENLDKNAAKQSATLQKNSVSTGKKKKRFTPQAGLKPVTSLFKRTPSNKKKSPKPEKKKVSSPKYKSEFAQKPAPKSSSNSSSNPSSKFSASSKPSSTFSAPSKPFNVKKEGEKRSVSPKKNGRMTPNRPLQKPAPVKRKGTAANSVYDRGVSFHSY